MDNILLEILRLSKPQFISYMLISIIVIVLSTYIIKISKHNKNNFILKSIIIINFILLCAMVLNFIVFVLTLDAFGYDAKGTTHIIENIYSLFSIITPLFWLSSIVLYIVRK